MAMEYTPMEYTPTTFEYLFKRCVEGCTGTPACPVCEDGKVCSLIAPTCNECQKTVCVSESTIPSTISNSSRKSSSGPNVGAIAGGVIGGVVAIAVFTYLVWRFCIKTKRQQYEQDDWADDEATLDAEKEFTMRRDARASTHTVASIASTVLTRASNIIQIAYIPGVTNRSAPSTPGLLVPPVPPIPIALSSNDGSPRYEQEHFFMPRDLRDSTWSGISDQTSRTSYARTSVASTIYGKNAVVSPIPAQTVIRGKAAVVSVKPTASSGELTPPVPSVNFSKYGAGGPPSPAFSVGSTFLNSTGLNNASAATQVKPQLVRVVSSKKSSLNIVSDDETIRQSTRDSNAITIIDDTPTVDQGPFRDPSTPGAKSLSSVTEEAPKKTRTTPFGDEHEVKDA